MRQPGKTYRSIQSGVRRYRSQRCSGTRIVWIAARPPGARTRSIVAKNVPNWSSPIASIISIETTFVNSPSTVR